MANEVEEVVLLRLSSARLHSYLRACDDDLSAAITLYLWNSQISGAFLEVLGVVEVVVRNAWHQELTKLSLRLNGNESWADGGLKFLRKNSIQHIEEARQRVMTRRHEVNSNQLVAELNFGFWRFLLAKQYRTTLWPMAGKHAFPNLNASQIGELSNAMGQMHDLRNRIAHHEPIHRRNLEKDYSDCLWIIGGVCQVTRGWVESNARIPEILRNRPIT